MAHLGDAVPMHGINGERERLLLARLLYVWPGDSTQSPCEPNETMDHTVQLGELRFVQFRRGPQLSELFVQLKQGGMTCDQLVGSAQLCNFSLGRKQIRAK